MADGIQEEQNAEAGDEDQPSYEGAAVSKYQAQVLLLSYVFRHDVSHLQLEDFCKIMDLLFPGILPKSAYRFKKGIPEIDGKCQYYVYCSNCTGLLGCSDALDENGECKCVSISSIKNKAY
jgi:hypothetical protein